MPHAPRLAIVVALVLIACHAPTGLAGESPATFAGRWETTYGPMDLKVTEGQVSGTYGPAGALAAIEGKVTGLTLTFTYSEPNAKGEGTFEVAPDGRTFAGKWRVLGGANWSEWTGKRLPPPPLPFTGLWKTTYGRMRLRQTGDKVRGVYDFAGGSTVTGTVTGNALTFTYEQPDGEKGGGTFELAADRNSFAGSWKAAELPDALKKAKAAAGAPAGKLAAEGGEGGLPNPTWSGTRVVPQANRTWLVVLEANWERDLEEEEYSFGVMLRTFFARTPGVKVRHRFFADEADFRRWAGELTYLAEPVVLHVSSHGDKDGIRTRGGQLIDAKVICESLRDIGDLKLLHFGTCLVAGGEIPARVQKHFANAGGPRFPISGYANSADWGGSAVIDFTYLDLILARGMAPADAFAQTTKMLTFAGSKHQEGDAIAPAGLVFVPPK